MKAVLLTGIPGLEKTALAKKFRRYYLQEHLKLKDVEGLHGERFEAEAQQHIPILELFDTSPYERETPLDDFYNDIRDRAGEFSADQTLPALGQSPKFKFVIFHTHLSYWLSGHFRSWLGMVDIHDLLKSKGIEVAKIINLMDNIFVHHKRLEGALDLKETFLWRDVELMVSEVLASQLYTLPNMRRNFKVLAVNHSLKTLARLIDDSHRQIYLAYPISAVRRLKAAEQQSAFDQNVRFRAAMEREVVAYDPAAIDELPLLFKFAETGSVAETTHTKISVDDLWPTFLTVAERISVDTSREWEVANSEIETVLGAGGDFEARVRGSLVAKQIRSRDLTMVFQAEGVVAYRPTLGGRWSRSVEIEVRRAKERLRRPFYLICDKDDPDVNDHGMAPLEFGYLPENVSKLSLSDTAAFEASVQGALKYVSEKLTSGKGRGPV